MAGSAAAYQVELLRNDIEDVNSVILDVVSRVGPLQQTSWKFPDRNGYDIDIADLLQKYKLSDDENEQLIIQTALLELLIDRFLLLLHALASFVDQRSLCPPQSDRDRMNLKSAGITARQYWRKIGSLVSVFAELQKEIASRDDRIGQLEAALSSKGETAKPKQSGVALNSVKERKPDSQPRNVNIAAETCVRGTQTVDTAFRPCESCAVVQEGLRSVLDCVSNLVITQNVPSSVAKFKKSYDSMIWLSATDLQRLVPELSCDLDKIQRQWSWLFSQLDPLRLEIDKLTKELESTKQELQRKKIDLSVSFLFIILPRANNVMPPLTPGLETLIEEISPIVKNICVNTLHANTLKEAETKWASADKEAQNKITELRQRNESLIFDKEHLLGKVEMLQNSVEEKQRLLEEFQRLQANLDGLSAESQVINEHLVAVTSDRDSLRNALHNAKEELNRSTMLAESMRARCEGLQSKQDALLEQMSIMDRSSDDYRIKISNLEGQLDATREHLEDKRRELEQAKQEKMKLELEVEQVRRLGRPPSAIDTSRQSNRNKQNKEESPIAELQAKLTSLQSEVAEYRHKEMLLLAFPDPNGPLPFADPSGDITTDLERQIGATELRAQLLQDQALQLSKSLHKLRETKGQRNTKSEGGIRHVEPKNGFEENVSSKERPSSASNSGNAKLFSKRSITFVVKSNLDKGGADDVELDDDLDVDSFKEKVQEISRTKGDSVAAKSGLFAQQGIQLWRLPVQREESESGSKNGDVDPVAAALSAYRSNGQNDAGNLKKIGFSDTASQPRSRSNSYSRPDPVKQEDYLKQLKSEKDRQNMPSLPSLPSLPSGAKASTASTAATSIVSRAMTRQTAIAAEMRLKAGLSSAKQRQQQQQQQQQRPNNVPPQPPSSPYSQSDATASISSIVETGAGGNRLNWDLFSCSRCSKTYSNHRDLDIHSAYCNSNGD